MTNREYILNSKYWDFQNTLGQFHLQSFLVTPSMYRTQNATLTSSKIGGAIPWPCMRQRQRYKNLIRGERERPNLTVPQPRSRVDPNAGIDRDRLCFMHGCDCWNGWVTVIDNNLDVGSCWCSAIGLCWKHWKFSSSSAVRGARWLLQFSVSGCKAVDAHYAIKNRPPRRDKGMLFLSDGRRRCFRLLAFNWSHLFASEFCLS